MKRRSVTEAPFLVRDDEVWDSLGVRRPEMVRMFAVLGACELARRGLLRPDEIERLRRIAAGAETCPRIIQADQAALVLRKLETHSGGMA